ncbi:uncharacterized protein LOC122172792 [Chrysemys picta bellii]|uniref:uncharacterized protein LOC122172792 n=1 Tax=Chrysemys picta bellii TaxID=8478 RepID=UPI0032B2D5F6
MAAEPHSLGGGERVPGLPGGWRSHGAFVEGTGRVWGCQHWLVGKPVMGLMPQAALDGEQGRTPRGALDTWRTVPSPFSWDLPPQPLPLRPPLPAELPLPGSLDSPSLSPPVLPRVEVPSPVVRRDEDSALVCCVRGFYPQHIAVSWLRDGQELNASFVSAARRGHRDGTFSLVTVYSFTPTERDLGALFSCRAQHPLLNQSRQADFRIAFRGPEEERGRLELGLKILLWMLRGALLLAMVLGGWSCYCSGRRRGQVRESIWTPRRWRLPWGAARGSGRGTGGAVPAERLEKGIP